VTVCAARTDSPGSFTSCFHALGKCACGEQVAADLITEATTDSTEQNGARQ
jgi:hypothetical protein